MCQKKPLYMKRDLRKRPKYMKRELWKRPIHGTSVGCCLAIADLKYDKCVKRDLCIWKETYERDLYTWKETYTRYFCGMLPRYSWPEVRQMCQKRPLYMKRDLRKRPIYMNRDLHTALLWDVASLQLHKSKEVHVESKETYANQKRPIKRDLCESKETYVNQKRFI